jgi:RNA polymerase sigma-70 factor (ECF subfamily)
MSSVAPDPEQLALVQELFLQHLPALRGFVLSLVSDFSLVDDVVQETFLTVNAKAASFKPGTNFRAWVLTIARYKVLQALARTRLEQHLSPDVVEALAADESAVTWHSEEQLRLLAACLEKLAPQARRTIELRYQQAHRPPEIAQLMNWTVESVGVTLSRARQFLRECVARGLKTKGT